MIPGSTGGRSPWLKFIDVQEQYGRHIIDRFAAQIASTNPTETPVICDLGVGQGHDLQTFQPYFPSAEYYGLDFTDANAAALQAHRIQLSTLDLEHDRLPFADDSLDIIIANQVYEHLKEIFWVSHQITQKLRIGGHLIIGVPNICAFHNRLRFLLGHQPSQMKSYSAHIRGFAPREIPRFFQTCFPQGYQLKVLTGAQFYPFPRAIARPLARTFPQLAHSTFYLLQKQRPYTDEFLQHPQRAHLETKFYLGE
jgi:trans-aconitate methyltransferase